MKKINFIVPLLTIASLLLISCKNREVSSNFKSQGRKKGDLKGYQQIESILKSKLVERKSRRQFHLASFLSTTGSYSTSDGEIDGFSRLLGTFEGIGERNHAKNSEPNGVNTMLWYMAMQRISEEISNNCGKASEDYKIHRLQSDPHFAMGLDYLCQLYSQKELNQSKLTSVWHSVIDYGVPEEEFSAWSQHLLQHKSNSKSAKDFVAGAYLTLLMNPYFLLIN